MWLCCRAGGCCPGDPNTVGRLSWGSMPHAAWSARCWGFGLSGGWESMVGALGPGSMLAGVWAWCWGSRLSAGCQGSWLMLESMLGAPISPHLSQGFGGPAAGGAEAVRATSLDDREDAKAHGDAAPRGGSAASREPPRALSPAPWTPIKAASHSLPPPGKGGSGPLRAARDRGSALAGRWLISSRSPLPWHRIPGERRLARSNWAAR